MDYSFNGDVAKLYGVDGAIFIHNIYWWVRKNKANGTHFYAGKWWTYNSVSAWQELFPFWTTNQIRRILERLEKSGAIIVGNYNAVKYDHTKWYTVAETIWQIYQFDLANLPNRSGIDAKPIPVSKPVSKPVMGCDLTEFGKELQAELEKWLLYKAESKKKYTEIGLQSFLTRIRKAVVTNGEAAVVELIELSIVNGWAGVVWERLKPPEARRKTLV